MGTKRKWTGDGGSNNHQDGKRSKSTLFVTNLPYSFSSSDLETAFSDVGPVRRCFMVTNKGSNDSRGFGFVQFAVADDASRALQLKNGTPIGGRKVKVELALLRHIEHSERSGKSKGGESEGSEKRKDDSTETEGVKFGHGRIDDENFRKTKGAKSEFGEGRKENPGKTKKAKSEDGGSRNVSSAETKPAKTEDGGSVDENHAKSKLANSRKSGKAKGAKFEHDESGNMSSVKSKEAKCEDGESGKGSEKQRVARTVVVGGFNSSVSEEAFNSVKEIDPMATINHSLPESELQLRGLTRDGCRKEACSVLFSSVRLARRAVEILHQKEMQGANLWARQLGGEGSKTKKWRVIVRNLPFDVTAEEVKRLFQTAGFVWNILIPISPQQEPSKGFCFVTFTCKKDTENAITKLNGQKIRKRVIAVDWALPKKVYANTRESLGKSDEDDSSCEEDDEEEMVDKETEVLHDDQPEGNDFSSEIKVDEAEITRKVLHNLISGSLEGDNEAPNTNSSGSLPQDKELDPEGEVSKKRRKLASDVEKTLPKQEDHDLDRTIFITNLPFGIEEQEVKQHFSLFGKVQSYLPVLHKVTGRPKGTAFLKFESPEGANAAVTAAENLKGVILRGRQLSVKIALNKKLAKEKEEIKNVKEERDHRNLYLAKEGLIVRGSPAAIGVSNEDMTKRESLSRKKAEKLQSPNFHVSRTRLIVYNVPKSMTAPELKKLFVEAVIQRATKQKPIIKQVKILKDEKKSTADTKPRQRGVAFVEFSEHQHALVALRVLNNNPETFGPERRPIVEFAVENIHVVKRRTQMANAQKEKQETIQHPITENHLGQNPKLNRKIQKMVGKKGAAKVLNVGEREANEGTSVTKEEAKTNGKRSKGGMAKSRRLKGRVHQEEGKHIGIGSEAQGKRIMKRKHEDDVPSEQSKKKKAAEYKKENQPELADKLDRLIAQYRTRISGRSNDKKQSNGETKRWFQ